MGRKPLRRRIVFFVSAAALLFSVYSSYATTCETTSMIGPRPSTWAIQMKSTCHVPNFYKINNDLYRSAQPTAIGMEQLRQQIGIKTIINLRTFHSDTDEIGSSDLLNERLYLKNWHVEDEDVIKVMRILANRENGPYLIHCWYGADRTGVMCAMYRIIYQGWTKEQAIDEMVNGGYGFYHLWTNIIHYIQSADIDRLKKAIQAK
jgi:protein tyrosine/serine phosphatase